MRSNLFKYSVGLFLSVSLFACSKYPSDVLHPKDMINVLADIQVAQAIYQNRYQEFNTPEKKDALIESILQKHEITQAILDSSLVWYSDHPEQYLRITDSVSAQLKRKEEYYRLEYAKVEPQKLVIPKYYNLNYADPVFTFKLDSLKIEELGRDVVFSFNAIGALKSEINATLAYEFSDTTLFVNKTINRNIAYTFEKPDYPLGLKSVSGYVKLNPKTRSENVMLYKMNIASPQNY